MNRAIKTLLATGNQELVLFTKRDLLGEQVDTEELYLLLEERVF